VQASLLTHPSEGGTPSRVFASGFVLAIVVAELLWLGGIAYGMYRLLA
jgi:hypothetical protein